MNRTGLIAIVGTAVAVALILIVANFNIQVSSKKDQAAAAQPTQNPVSDDHHGGGSVDSAVFDSLIGKSAPDFTLENFNGEKITLSSLKGKNVLLFFNEGLMCYPACWNQIAAFGKDTSLQNKAVILNITVDPKKDWQQAVSKMPELAQATVVFDTNREVSQKYGVLTLPSSMHKGQFPGHSYIIVGKDGTIKFSRDDVSMAVRNNELSAELEKI